MKNFFTLLACLFFYTGQAQNLIDQLIGTWHTEVFGGNLYTSWQNDSQGGYVGSGVFLEGQDTTYREHVRFFLLGEKWMLVASPVDYEPYVFELTSSSENELVFENSRFQNPQKIVYQLKADGTFYRRTEGRNNDGMPTQNEYFFKRIGEVSQAATEPQAEPAAVPTTPRITKKSVPESAKIFAPAVLSTAAPEFATAISPDGASLLFNRMSDDRKTMYLMLSERTDGAWSEPKVAPFSSSEHWDVDPFFTPDGRYLFFSSNRPRRGKSGKDFNIWVVEKKEDGWSKPLALGKSVNTSDDEIFTSLTTEGHLYFTRMKKDSRAIVRSELRGKKYQLGVDQSIAEGAGKFGNPAISPDEKFLIFSSDGLDGFGKSDLFLTWRSADGSWSEPQNLGVYVNSPEVEFAPSISPDGQWLYFTSERPGMVQNFAEGERRPGDLYRVALPPILETLER